MAPRWVVFDPATASELRSLMPAAAVFEAPGRATVEYAAASRKSVVVVLPGMPGSLAAIAVFRPEKRTEVAPAEKTVRTRPRGILGLSEEIEYEEEAPQEKKKWWRR